MTICCILINRLYIDWYMGSVFLYWCCLNLVNVILPIGWTPEVGRLLSETISWESHVKVYFIVIRDSLNKGNSVRRTTKGENKTPWW